MNNIIQFIPKATKSAHENLNEFIRACREDLTAFGAELNFESNIWNIANSLRLKGNRNKQLKITFGNYYGESHWHNEPKPFHGDVLNFAKAYIRYMHAMRPTAAYNFRLAVFKALNEVLQGKSITELTPIEANTAANWLHQTYSSGVAYGSGNQLESLIKFMRDKRMLINNFSWSNFIERPITHARVGKEADERRVKKLPSRAALDAIPQIFRMASAPRDILVSSVMAILCASPDRISEVMELPLDCEVFQKAKDGSAKYGLRWWPAKGALPQVKWIIPSMVEVVQEAIKRIKKISEEARQLAIWYESNPSKMYLPPELEYLRGKELLRNDEVVQVIGLSDGRASTRSFMKAHKLKGTLKGRNMLLGFKELEAKVLSMLPEGFPYFDKNRKLKYSDILFLARRNEFRTTKATYLCMFQAITSTAIQSYLGKDNVDDYQSIFTANGFFEPDGSPIKVGTHQFRHYLNTLAQAGGMSQLDIAKWSGRKDVRQNDAYDHVSGVEMIQMIRNAVGDPDKSIGPLAHLSGKTLIPRDEFARLIVPTAHSTDIGFCTHDYAMSPCDACRDCINCQEMVCIKGDKTAERNIKMALDESHKLLKEAEHAVSEEYYGANRWQEHHEQAYERLSQLNTILDDKTIPDGTVIRLSKPKNAIESKTIKITNGDKK